MSYLGPTKIGQMFLGSVEIGKAYLGSDLVFQKGGTPPEPPTPGPGDLSNYVQDGLVMHLDGIEKGGVSGRWSSLVGSTYFTLTSHATSEAKAILMDGAGRLTATNPVTAAYNVGTVEVCAEYLGSSTGAIFFGQSNGLAMVWAGSGYAFAVRTSSNQWNITKASLFTASANSARFMLNGVAGGTKATNSFGSGNSNCYIGGRDKSSYYYANVRIHSIRLYSRQLSEAEMLQNQKVDNARFNLGLNI